MPRLTRLVLWVGVIVASVSALATRAAADDPVSSSVRFNREIVRILQRRCLPCHMPGSLSVPLAAYGDVRDWGRAIREEVVEQRMPPPAAAPGYGRFDNALGLTARETATLLAWLDGGMPRGDERDLPATLEPTSGETRPGSADVRIELPPQEIPALEDVVVRRVTIDPRLTRDQLVSRVIVRPGSRAVLRGAVIYAGPGERSWVGAWLPWQETLVSPASHAFLLPKRSLLTLVLYYRGTDQRAVDRSAVELQFAPEPRQPLDTFHIEASKAGEGRLTVSVTTTLWALQPQVAATTRSLELRVRRPGGAIEVLLWIPTVRPEWLQALVLGQPAVLPAGTELILSTDRADPAAPPDRVILSGWLDAPAAGGGRPSVVPRVTPHRR